MSELLDLEKIDENYFKFKNSAAVIGFFDGVHLGHREIINACIEKAKMLNGKSIVLTFNKPPINVIKSKTQKKLIISFEEKIKIIGSLGVDYIVIADINTNFLKLTPAQFCKDILINKLCIKEIFVGDGFHFGYQAAGDVFFMNNFFKTYHVKVNVVPLLKVEDELVSSTNIRKYYSEGRIKKITGLLGRNPQVEGIVIKGVGRGKQLGFPTANIDICDFFVTPADGVYLGKVLINGEGDKMFPAIINVGKNPTFGESKKWIEAFLLNFKGNIYNKKIKITFLEKLRDEMKFASKDNLIKQIRLDLNYAKKYFKI